MPEKIDPKDLLLSVNKIKTEIVCLELQVNINSKEEYLKRLSLIKEQLNIILEKLKNESNVNQ